jgi:hypothetical protein
MPYFITYFRNELFLYSVECNLLRHRLQQLFWLFISFVFGTGEQSEECVFAPARKLYCRPQGCQGSKTMFSLLFKIIGFMRVNAVSPSAGNCQGP